MNRLIVLEVITASLLSCTSKQADMENRLRKFITECEKKVIPLYRESSLADWATKIHVALYPCYYHNYLPGDLPAAQYYHYIATNVTEVKSFKGEKAVGDYLKKMVFSVGAKYDRDEMITRSTGEKLTAKYYADQFVN